MMRSNSSPLTGSNHGPCRQSTPAFPFNFAFSFATAKQRPLKSEPTTETPSPSSPRASHPPPQPRSKTRDLSKVGTICRRMRVVGDTPMTNSGPPRNLPAPSPWENPQNNIPPCEASVETRSGPADPSLPKPRGFSSRWSSAPEPAQDLLLPLFLLPKRAGRAPLVRGRWGESSPPKLRIRKSRELPPKCIPPPSVPPQMRSDPSLRSRKTIRPSFNDRSYLIKSTGTTDANIPFPCKILRRNTLDQLERNP